VWMSVCVCTMCWYLLRIRKPQNRASPYRFESLGSD
jgi:hypothetical protein